MGLCVSMLQRKPKNRHPEPRRGTPKVLFVVRNDRRPSKPQALVVNAQNPGSSGFQKPKPRLPCGSTSVAVDPVVPEQRESVFEGVTTERSAVEGCRTPMTPRRTPVWQRRILLGSRCELPRFSWLILYDERGQPLQSSIQNREDHRISRARKPYIV